MTDYINRKIFIGVPTAEYSRTAMFYDYLNMLHKPEGTIGAGFHTNSGARNRNLIINEAKYNNCTHILFIDDDMAFAPDSLTRLLRHDKEVISGLYFNRAYPHSPILYDFDPITRYGVHYLGLHERGVIECEAVGFGFLLTKIGIFDLLEEPYVREGEVLPDRRSEDVGFCLRLRAAGVKIHCDLDTPIGHIGQATIWPNCIDGLWHTAVDTYGNQMVNIPQLQPKLEVTVSKD